MNVKDTLKTGMKVRWKNSEFEVGDVTDDWVELKDDKGIPIIIKSDRIRGLTKNGGNFNVRTESKLPSERILELAGLNEGLGISNLDAARFLDKISDGLKNSDDHMDRQDSKRYKTIADYARKGDIQKARRVFADMDTAARDHVSRKSGVIPKSDAEKLAVWLDIDLW